MILQAGNRQMYEKYGKENGLFSAGKIGRSFIA